MEGNSNPEFYVGEEVIAIAKEYNYLGCVLDEHGWMLLMNGDKEGKGWSSSPERLAQEVYSLDGGSQKGTFGNLLEMLVGSVLQYGVEVWECGKKLRPKEKVQMRAVRIFMGQGAAPAGFSAV